MFPSGGEENVSGASEFIHTSTPQILPSASSSLHSFTHNGKDEDKDKEEALKFSHEEAEDVSGVSKVHS